MGHVLLTGATGLLGRYLMRDLLERGTKLAVLVRPSRRQDPQSRVEAAMRTWDQRLGRRLPRPVVLAGDICTPDFGLSHQQIKWACENVDSIIHNAASLSFVSTGRHAEPWKSNVDGTQNVLDFMAQANLKKLFHVSTAYVAGRHSGTFHETDLDLGQEFGNPYEESKVAAEKLTRENKNLDSLTVFRPGIIVGDSQTGLTFTYHNFYVLLHVARTLTMQMPKEPLTGKNPGKIVRLNMNGTEYKNLVPVDWVSEIMANVVVDSALHGKTYNLTPRVPVPIRLITEIIEEVFDVYGVRFYGQGDRQADAHEAEDILFQQMQVYSSYWRDDPVFDSTNTQQAFPDRPCPHVDRKMLTLLAQFALEQCFNWRDPKPEAVPTLVAT